MGARSATVGEQVKVRGLNMRCEPTVEIARVVELLDPPIDHGVSPRTGKNTISDCVIKCGGVKIMACSASFIRS